MSVATSSTQWSNNRSGVYRYKSSVRNKNSLLCENVKNFPHRESLVKKSSPLKQSRGPINLSSSSIDSNLLSKSMLKHPQGNSSELMSELSVQLDTASRVSTLPPVAGTVSAPKPYGKRGNLLGPFKFMTSEVDQGKLKHYSKGHLETLLKQLDLLQFLLVSKFDEDRKESDLEIMKSWMAVHQKEEEAFTICIREKTVEEVHSVHNRLVDMVRRLLFFFFTFFEFLISSNDAIRKKIWKKFVRV